MSKKNTQPKYLIAKGKCSICGKVGTLQIIKGKYSRIRHYLNRVNGKPQFSYCHIPLDEAYKILTLDRELKASQQRDLLSSRPIPKTNTIDLKAPYVDQSLKDLKPISENKGGRSLAWLGHRLPKPTTRVQIPVTALSLGASFSPQSKHKQSHFRSSRCLQTESWCTLTSSIGRSVHR